MHKTFARLFHTLIYVFASLFLFLFLILPMQSIQLRLGLNPAVYEKYSIALAAFAILGAALAFLFFQYFQKAPLERKGTFTAPTTKPAHKVTLLVLIALAATLFVRVLLGIERPFDMDELQMALDISEKVPMLHPLRDNAHPISHLLAQWSTQIFGLSMWSIRLPSVILCLLFLVLLVKFSLRNLPLFAGALLLAHLASSSIFVWYFHSARGYATMIVFIFAIFSFVYSVTSEKRSFDKKTQLILSALLLFLPFTHGFAILFGLLLPIAITAWFLANEKELGGTHRRQVVQLNTLLLCFSPYLAACLGYMFKLQAATGSKYVGMTAESKVSTDTALRAISTVLGSAHSISLKIVGLLTLGLLFLLFRKKAWAKDITLFILATFIGFILFQRTLLSTFIVGRFLLGALPLFIFWMSKNSFALLDKRAKVIVLPLLLICLVGFPALDGKPSLFQLPHDEYYDFMKAARTQLKGTPKNCLSFSFSGAPPAETEAYVAEKYFFTGRNFLKQGECEREYQLHFAWPWQTDESYSEAAKRMGTAEDLPGDKKYKLLQADGQGRFLAEIERN